MRSSKTHRSLEEMLEAADRLPCGLMRLSLYEEAVRWADIHADVSEGFRMRRLLIEEAAACLRYDLYAVAFSWCLSKARAHPETYPLSDLLGRYSDVLGKIVNFPDVSRAQYESMFEEVVHEHRICGLSLRQTYLERRSAAIDFGDRAMAVAADREWRKWRRDSQTTVEFETVRQIEHDSFMSDPRSAARAVDNHFARRGRDHTCDAWISSLALMPLLRTGRLADAAAHYRSAGVGGWTVGYIWGRSFKLEYLARIGNLKEGLREFRLQLPSALAQADPLSRFYCLRPSRLLFDRIVENGTRTITMKAPVGVPWADPSGRYETAAIRDWLRSETCSVAMQFDRRNGNTFYSEWLAGNS